LKQTENVKSRREKQDLWGLDVLIARLIGTLETVATYRTQLLLNTHCKLEANLNRRRHIGYQI